MGGKEINNGDNIDTVMSRVVSAIDMAYELGTIKGKAETRDRVYNQAYKAGYEKGYGDAVEAQKLSSAAKLKATLEAVQAQKSKDRETWLKNPEVLEALRVPKENIFTYNGVSVIWFWRPNERKYYSHNLRWTVNEYIDNEGENSYYLKGDILPAKYGSLGRFIGKKGNLSEHKFLTLATQMVSNYEILIQEGEDIL